MPGLLSNVGDGAGSSGPASEPPQGTFMSNGTGAQLDQLELKSQIMYVSGLTSTARARIFLSVILARGYTHVHGVSSTAADNEMYTIIDRLNSRAIPRPQRLSLIHI